MRDHIELTGQKQNLMNDVAEICLSLSWVLGCLISQHQLLQVILKNPHLPALAFSPKEYVKNSV